MSTLQAVLAAIGGLFGLAVIGGALWAFAKSGAQDAVIKRLRDERDDYLSRLNFIEPRFKSATEQNELLRTLIDPSARLNEIRETVDEKAGEILSAVERSASNTEAMKGVLLAQARMLHEIRDHVHVEREDGP